ncbi:MAG: KpsF/GutQ family sugar-phosphate isomerase [Hyphomicrobiaceae bacterium]
MAEPAKASRTGEDPVEDGPRGSALRTLELETAGLAALHDAISGPLSEPFAAAVNAIRNAPGRVIVTGVGKSGHIGQKIAATLASTGTPAFFVHANEASHGDLGMITPDDVVAALSWSGETVELTNVLNYTRRFSVPLVALTSQSGSALGKAADIVLALPRETEACPHGLAPTTSTVMQLAIGDCLAIALLENRAFTKQDFKIFHPGGQLGASLRYVSDIMHAGDAMPLTFRETPMADALVTMTTKSFGCIGIVDENGKLIGIITDGDLRRKMADNLLSKTVQEVMTPNPKTIAPDVLAPAALEMLSGKITAAFVVEDEKPVGIIHLHDLLRAGVA